MTTRTRTAARQIIRPVVGERGWMLLRRVGRGYARQLAAQASRRRGELEGADMANDLSRLAVHYGTDKWGAHRYTPHYQRHLGHLRDRDIRLLEIGIGGYSRADQGGASLRMWKAFLPRAQIIGLDLHDKSFVNEERIRAYRGDQTDASLLRRISDQAGPFDVIIDDGSHRPAHIIETFRILFPLLKVGGVYVVEDTQTSYWPEWGGSENLDSAPTSMAFFKRLADGLNWEEFVDEQYEPKYTDHFVSGLHFYHNMVFVEKNLNQEGTRKKQILKKRYQ